MRFADLKYWSPLARTTKEKLQNDLIRLKDLIAGDQYFIDKDLIEKATKEYNRLMELYNQEIEKK